MTPLQGLDIRQVEAGGEPWFAVVTGLFLALVCVAANKTTPEQNDLYTWGVHSAYANGNYLGHGAAQGLALSPCDFLDSPRSQ